MQGEEGFFGRRATLDWINRGLHNPVANSLVLFGQRRIGKTTLLLQLRRTLPAEDFLAIYFDLEGQAVRPLGQVLADLADAIAERSGFESPDPRAFDDRGVFFSRTFLPQVCESLEPDRRLVILFDEFEVLDRATEEDLPSTAAVHALLRLIRRVMTKVPNPAFVFTIGRRVDDLALDFTAQFKASLVREIWVLDPASTEAMIRQAEANRTLTFTDRAVSRIFGLTQGHPYLTQLLCHQIWERAYASPSASRPQIDVTDVEIAVPDVLETVNQAMAWLWRGLSLAEQIYAAGLAETLDEGEPIQEEEGMCVLAGHAARLLTREVELTAPRDLVRRRVLDLVDEREHRFTIDLFRRWIREHQPLHVVKEKLDRVDPLADELFGIGQEFYRRNQWKTATRYFRDALAANPNHFHARLRLGETLLQLGRFDQAVDELEWTYEQDHKEACPILTRALVAQARARQEAGEEESALRICKRALNISPHHRAAQKVHDAILITRLEAEAQEYERAKRWGKAAVLYERLIHQAPDSEHRERWEAASTRCRNEERLIQLFTQGQKALENRDWPHAQRAFAEIVHARPDYRVEQQWAARLLQRAVFEKPSRKPARWLAPLVISLLLVLAGVTWRYRPWQRIDVMPPVNMPAHQQHVHTYRLDVNHDGEEERVVLYRFDIPDDASSERAPIAGAVYQSAHDTLSTLTRYELRPPDGNYLCECRCVATMEDVLSGLPGPELVIRDRCNGEMTRLSIFRWDAEAAQYRAQGHFSGSQLEVERDTVIVNQRIPHRAQLLLRQTYHARENRTYYQPGELGIPVMPDTYELTFYQGEPQDVTRSPYPEKVVLSFYHHYDEGEQISRYFTEQGWQRLKRCSEGSCGCALPPGEAPRVRVTNLQSTDELLEGTKDTSAWAIIDANVICGDDDQEKSVRWRLVWQGDQWKLDDAEVLSAD